MVLTGYSSMTTCIVADSSDVYSTTWTD